MGDDVAAPFIQHLWRRENGGGGAMRHATVTWPPLDGKRFTWPP